MHRFISILSVLMLWRIAVVAQADAIPVFRIIKDDTIDLSLQNNSWQILADSTGRWTIDDVVNDSINKRFITHSRDFGPTERAWIRFRLFNTMDHDARILISSNANYCDLYSSTDGTDWQQYRTGFFVPWSKRDGLKLHRAIPITIRSGESLLVFMKMQYDFRFNYQESISIKISFADIFIQSRYIEDSSYQTYLVLSAVVFGIFVIAMVINFFFYVVSREKVNLYFALSLLSIGLFYFSDNLYLLLFKEHPIFFAFLFPVFLALTLFFALNTLRLFLQVHLYYPRWDLFLKALSAIPFIVLAGVFFFRVRMQLFEWLPALIFINAFITALLFLKNKSSTVRLTIVAVLPVFFFTGLMMAVILIAEQLEAGGYITIPASIRWFLNNRDYFEYICQLWLIVVFSWSFFRRFQSLQQQIASENLEKERLAKEREIEKNEMIAAQKLELEKQVNERTAELKQSLEDLKETQSQLIHAEKMASLGELTAGIAHEIQNPLNFVNNFSDVNREMIDELNEEAERGNWEGVKTIAENIRENEVKINHHGKRADAIVKGMLQHSRAGMGQKESVSLNSIVDEYVRLCYHGIRAKDNSFNATIKADFDQSITTVKLVPQDIGRVMLNLLSNAFYAVNERHKQKINGYEPTVTIKTKGLSDKVQVIIGDNGTGIPADLQGKIFQPFFTTKPTGAGTGLGLSLVYDIINAHGGDIRVDSNEGEGSVFTVTLPDKK